MAKIVGYDENGKPMYPYTGKKRGKPGQSYPNRLLTALASIFEDEGISPSERMQAARLAADVLPMRRIPRRKTDHEKLVEAALKKSKDRKIPKTGK